MFGQTDHVRGVVDVTTVLVEEGKVVVNGSGVVEHLVGSNDYILLDGHVIINIQKSCSLTVKVCSSDIEAPGRPRRLMIRISEVY